MATNFHARASAGIPCNYNDFAGKVDAAPIPPAVRGVPTYAAEEADFQDLNSASFYLEGRGGGTIVETVDGTITNSYTIGGPGWGGQPDQADLWLNPPAAATAPQPWTQHELETGKIDPDDPRYQG